MGLHLQTTKHVWPSYLRKRPPNHTRQPGLNQKHKLSSVTGFVVQKSRDLLIFSSFFHLKRSEKTVGIARSHRSPRSEDRLKVVFEASTKTGRKCWENPEIFISLFWFMVEISMVYTPEYDMNILGFYHIHIIILVEISIPTMVYKPT
jgi:hypothetical protein